jgi:hypothetical protein
MTDPITPPPELVSKWCCEDGEEIKSSPRWFFSVFAKAAQWGADQELEACAKWVGSMFHGHKTWSDELRAARRPKPPSLKEQALRRLDCITGFGDDKCIIRRALEALPE